MPTPSTPTLPCDCTTSDTGCGESVLDAKIAQFEIDIDLSHQIVHGGATTVVQTEGGPVPSFAKLLSDIGASYTIQWQQTLHSMQGTVAKSYQFQRSLIWHVTHNLDCVEFNEVIRSSTGQRLYAHVEVISPMEFMVEFTEPEEGNISVVFFKDGLSNPGVTI